MSVRFEVIYNGKRMCIAGIQGDGILSVGIDHVKRPDEDAVSHLHVGGLGRFDPSVEQDHHVSWPVPDKIQIGDEITVRLLPEGEFDAPPEMEQSPTATLQDPVFGKINYNVDGWDGTVAFPFPPISTAHVHITADENGPSGKQQHLFQELTFRYPGLWPQITDALLRCHPFFLTVFDLNESIDSNVCINIYDESNTLEICYTFCQEERRAYFIKIQDGELIEVCSAD